MVVNEPLPTSKYLDGFIGEKDANRPLIVAFCSVVLTLLGDKGEACICPLGNFFGDFGGSKSS